MKRTLAIILSVALLFSFVGCASSTDSKKTVLSSESTEVVDIATENSEVSTTTEPSDEGAEWKQFLKEYEAWVDDYIALLKKYNKNPADMSILSDYMSMVSELTEWQSKTEEISAELENASAKELAEYSAELARIAAKITEAM